MRRLTVLILLVMPTVVFAKDRIAYIEFFGYEGIDVTAIRASLPFREGDALPPKFEEQARASVLRTLGREATDVSSVCCTSDGDVAVFIGLPGRSSHPFAFDSP